MPDLKISQLPPLTDTSQSTDDDLLVINNGVAGSQETKSVKLGDFKSILSPGSSQPVQVLNYLNDANKWTQNVSEVWGTRDPISMGPEKAGTVDIGDAPAALVIWQTACGTNIDPDVVTTVPDSEFGKIYTNRAYFSHSIKLSGGTWMSSDGADSLVTAAFLNVSVPLIREAIPKFSGFNQIFKQAVVVNGGTGNLTFTFSSVCDKFGWGFPYTYPGRLFVLPLDEVPSLTAAAGIQTDNNFYQSTDYASLVEYTLTLPDFIDRDTEQELREYEVLTIRNSLQSELSLIDQNIEYMTLKGQDTSAAEAAKSQLQLVREATDYDDLVARFQSAVTAAAPFKAVLPTS